MSGHTPGPWRVEGPDMFGDFNILHGGDSLAVGAVVSNFRAPEEVHANAMVTAAAPMLLEACQDSLEAFNLLLLGAKMGKLFGHKAINVMAAHIDELAFAIAKATP